MNKSIKTSHGIAMLGACFLLAIFLISQSSKQFNPIPQSILPHTQLAQAADVTDGLVGWWKFDEGSGTSAGDLSGRENNGTLVNGPVWTTDSKIGSGSMSFDGVDDYVSVAGNASLGCRKFHSLE